MPSSRGYSQPRDEIHVSYISCIWQARSLPLAPPGKPRLNRADYLKAISYFPPISAEDLVGCEWWPTTTFSSLIANKKGGLAPDSWMHMKEIISGTWDTCIFPYRRLAKSLYVRDLIFSQVTPAFSYSDYLSLTANLYITWLLPCLLGVSSLGSTDRLSPGLES